MTRHDTIDRASAGNEDLLARLAAYRPLLDAEVVAIDRRFPARDVQLSGPSVASEGRPRRSTVVVAAAVAVTLAGAGILALGDRSSGPRADSTATTGGGVTPADHSPTTGMLQRFAIDDAHFTPIGIEDYVMRQARIPPRHTSSGAYTAIVYTVSSTTGTVDATDGADDAVDPGATGIARLAVAADPGWGGGEGGINTLNWPAGECLSAWSSPTTMSYVTDGYARHDWEIDGHVVILELWGPAADARQIAIPSPDGDDVMMLNDPPELATLNEADWLQLRGELGSDRLIDGPAPDEVSWHQLFSLAWTVDAGDDEPPPAFDWTRFPLPETGYRFSLVRIPCAVPTPPPDPASWG